MGKKAQNPPPQPTQEEDDAATFDISATIPTLCSFPSPSSSSSSDFEFTVSLSPTSKRPTSNLCPADELFYKGQILPLHLTPRISMVRTLLLASSSGSSSSDTTATDSRDSSGSSNDSTASFNSDLLLLAAAAAAADCDSSRRPSSVTEDDAKKVPQQQQSSGGNHRLHSKYLSSLANRFSSVFHRNRKDHHVQDQSATITRTNNSTSASSTAKDVIKRYVKKVRPLYEKISHLQHTNQSQNQKARRHSHEKDDHYHGNKQQEQEQHSKKTFSFTMRRGGDKASKTNTTTANSVRSSTSSRKDDLACNEDEDDGENDHHYAGKTEIYSHSQSFSGNLRYPSKKKCAMAASCPSSMRSSPSHSGLLYPAGGSGSFPAPAVSQHRRSPSATSMEELQSAIQGAIAHCKNSMVQPVHKKLSTVSEP